MPKDMVFGADATKRILEGISATTDAAALTLGPKGRNVALDNKYATPTVTNDGVTVIQNIELEDAYMQIGARLVQEASSRTDEAFGDGTTTAAILTERIAKDGLRLVQAGANPMLLKKGIDDAVASIIATIEESAIPVEDNSDIYDIALVSSNGDKVIAQTILDAIEKMGTRGLIEVQDLDHPGMNLDIVDGYRFDRGYINEAFVRPGNTKIVLDNIAVLICEKKLSSLQEFMEVAEVLASNPQPLLVIADSIEGDVLTTIALNAARGIIQVAPVKAPGFGENRLAMLGDMAILTGTEVVGPGRGTSIKEMLQSTGLGMAQQVIVDRDTTTIIGGSGIPEAITERARIIRAVAVDKKTSRFDKERLLKRASYLEDGVAVIQVGGTTDTEQKERRMRVDDALGATRAATEGGICPGGGVALIHAAKFHSSSLEFSSAPMHTDIRLGHELVMRACLAPAETIASNAGESGEYIARLIQEQDDLRIGFNVNTMDMEDLMKAGVVDPAKVITSALIYASSISSMLLTVGCAIVEAPEEEE